VYFSVSTEEYILTLSITALYQRLSLIRCTLTQSGTESVPCRIIDTQCPLRVLNSALVHSLKSPPS